MTHSRQPAYDAVFAVIRREPSNVFENARVWRAVEAALNAMNVPSDYPPTGVRLTGELARIGGNSGHGYAWRRPDGDMAKCGGPGVCEECSYDQQLVDEGRRAS
ncbi:hypothetical protein ACIA5D_36955 [Actinoplanes sp. NPDC051513]|uniref:hypothetical protein n=1 Tax=Actinoplanes sp. NPDC051513 TaxID=3363908 RepID=UPI003797764C